MFKWLLSIILFLTAFEIYNIIPKHKVIIELPNYQDESVIGDYK